MKQNQIPERWLLALLVPVALLLGACAENFPLPVRGNESILTRPVQRDLFPGGQSTYDWGYGQSKENFANIEVGQYAYSSNTAQRTWMNIQPTNGAGATMLGLSAYSPLHVRWKLKDGREFILENIDVRAIMQEYFKTHTIQLQWQREGRPRAKSCDSGPLLVQEIKDDTVRIKWVISTNQTPVDQRFTATGAATKWIFTDEEYLVTTLKGNPTSGINFNNWYEIRK